ARLLLELRARGRPLRVEQPCHRRAQPPQQAGVHEAGEDEVPVVVQAALLARRQAHERSPGPFRFGHRTPPVVARLPKTGSGASAAKRPTPSTGRPSPSPGRAAGTPACLDRPRRGGPESGNGPRTSSRLTATRYLPSGVTNRPSQAWT